MKTKKLIILFTFLVTLCTMNAQTNWSAGIITGAPTGLTAKYSISNESSLNISLGWAVFHSKEFGLNADYVFNTHVVKIGNIKEKFGLYYGVGLRIGFVQDERNNIGGRGILGLNWKNSDNTLEIFTEVAPVFVFMPKTDFRFDAAVGFRFVIN